MVMQLLLDIQVKSFDFEHLMLWLSSPMQIQIWVSYQKIDEKYSTSTKMDLVLKKNDYGSKDILERVIVNQETQ